MKKIYVISLLSILMLVLILIFIRKSYYADTTVHNKSKQIISYLIVQIYDNKYEFKDVMPSEKISFSTSIYNDAHYKVQAEFKSGEKISKEIGYITSGFNYDNSICITTEGIEIILKPK